MKNYQRILFLIFSTAIVLTSLVCFKTTRTSISGATEKVGMTSSSIKQEVKTIELEEIEEEEVFEEEKRDVEDVSKTKQEIVTEVKSEYQGSVSEEEIIMLAKVIYAEAGGISSVTEQSCVAWTVLNRVDMDYYPDTIAECLTQPHQFAYRSSTKVTDHCLWLARDVVSRWERERAGETNVGRTLPQGYISFWGDGGHNYFRVSCNSYDYWDYSYGTPYDS